MLFNLALFSVIVPLCHSAITYDAFVNLGSFENTIYDIKLADLDGDGNVDLLAAQDGAGTGIIDVAYNLGGGLFEKPVPLFGTPVWQGESYRLGAVADMDGDGLLDVVACITYAEFEGLNGTHSILMGQNKGNREFSLSSILPRTELTDWPRCHDLDVADFDGDGDKDIVATLTFRYSGSKLVYFENDGSGSFLPMQTIDDNIITGVANIEVNDFDGDGYQDVAVVDRSRDTILLFWNEFLNGGRFILDPIEVGSNSKTLASGPLEPGSSRPDLVGIGRQSKWDSKFLEVYENKGNRKFQKMPPMEMSNYRIGFNKDAFFHAVVYDYDGDGTADIVTSEEYDGALLYRQLDGGSFALPERIVENPRTATALAFGDISGDGIPDLVIANKEAGNDQVIAYPARQADMVLPTMTNGPTELTIVPTKVPSAASASTPAVPSVVPSNSTSSPPTAPTAISIALPTLVPSMAPSLLAVTTSDLPTEMGSIVPTELGSIVPTELGSIVPTELGSVVPTVISAVDTTMPTITSSNEPSYSNRDDMPIINSGNEPTGANRDDGDTSGALVRAAASFHVFLLGSFLTLFC